MAKTANPDQGVIAIFKYLDVVCSTVEKIRERLIRQARKRSLIEIKLTGGRNVRCDGATRRIATPRSLRRKIDEALGRTSDRPGSDQLLVRGKAAAALRLEHMIGE